MKVEVLVQVRGRLAAVPAVAGVLIAPLLLAVPASAAGELEVVQLDVSQGDAALFRGPCGEIGLLDAGEGSAGAVTDQLRAWGAGAVAWAATSHYDADHIGDLADLPVAVPVVIDRGGGPAANSTATYNRYYTFAQARSYQGLDIGAVIRLCSGAQAVTFTVISAGTDGTAAAGVVVIGLSERGGARSTGASSAARARCARSACLSRAV